MPYDVLSLGELLVDMVAVRGGALSVPGRVQFERAAGGAPANVAAGAARLLGRRCRVGFVGMVGDDPFGRFLASTLETFGVDTTHLRRSPRMQSPVAIAGKAEGSQEMEFSFYGPEDGRRLVPLSTEDLPARDLRECRVLVLGGVGLSHPASAAASREAARLASEGRALVALDPNWRPFLWRDPSQWASAVRRILPYVDVLKVSRGEMALLRDTALRIAPEIEIQSATDGLARISAEGREPGKPLLVAVTMGGQGGAYALYSDPRASDRAVELGSVEAFPVDVVDPTGAGDAFLAGFITGLLDAAGGGEERGRLRLEGLDGAQLRRVVRFANAAGALATTRRGAMAGIPTRRAVERLLSQAGSRA